MFKKILDVIEQYIMVILSSFLILSLIINKVNILGGILISCMWFVFGYLSFLKGVACRMDDELTEIYRQKAEEEYNKK
tara:strand:+ start:57 stop:290 length:234 start_codon:yes stop_codon:yes gene_type:complete